MSNFWPCDRSQPSFWGSVSLLYPGVLFAPFLQSSLISWKLSSSPGKPSWQTKEAPRTSRKGSSSNTRPHLASWAGATGDGVLYRWEPAPLEIHGSTKPPSFPFVSAIIRDRCFSWIPAKSPLIIHSYFSQTSDVSDKYILGLFLIGKSNHSGGFEGRGELCQALLWFIDETTQFYHCLVRWRCSMWQPVTKFSLTL